MNTNDIARYEKKLKEELGTLTEELSSAGIENPDRAGDWDAKPDTMDVLPADENEVADQLESYQENRSVVDQLEKRYRQVAAALERIKDGTYGICKISGKPIEPERLEANPAAETSIAYKDEE